MAGSSYRRTFGEEQLGYQSEHDFVQSRQNGDDGVGGLDCAAAGGD